MKGHKKHSSSFHSGEYWHEIHETIGLSNSLYSPSLNLRSDLVKLKVQLSNDTWTHITVDFRAGMSSESVH